MWVVVDVPDLYLGNLTIYGTVEFDDSSADLAFTLSAEVIWVTGDGRLIAGFVDEGDHFPGDLEITLRGNFTFPERELIAPDGPAVGRKAIGKPGSLSAHISLHFRQLGACVN